MELARRNRSEHRARRVTRSLHTTLTANFLFLVFAALPANAVRKLRGRASIDLHLCENGLIALNPPLTARRIGSEHAERPPITSRGSKTFRRNRFGVVISNPHRHETKGEMLARRAAYR